MAVPSCDIDHHQNPVLTFTVSVYVHTYLALKSNYGTLLPHLKRNKSKWVCDCVYDVYTYRDFEEFRTRQQKMLTEIYSTPMCLFNQRDLNNKNLTTLISVMEWPKSATNNKQNTNVLFKAYASSDKERETMQVGHDSVNLCVNSSQDSSQDIQIYSWGTYCTL